MTAVAMRGVGFRDILKDIHLEISDGEVVQIVGPTGSGKSTLLRLINRLAEADSGEIDVLGKRITEWPIRDLRRSIGMVFQEPSLLGRTVRENLRLPYECIGEPPVDPETKLDPSFLDRTEDQLSVGQKQLVTIERALVTKPKILLLDEPTSALDPKSADEILQRLSELDGITRILVTHRVEEVPKLGGRTITVKEGRIE